MILIFTGPVGSGKTTALMNWSRGRDDAGGILMPLRNGKRMFRPVHSGKEFPAEAAEGEPDKISIGPYRFSAAAFDRAGREIIGASKKCGTLIIDEIGPLELMGIGFSEVLRSVLEAGGFTGDKNLILVVREGLVKQVSNYFNLEAYRIAFSIGEIGGILDE